jgi:hypothetical protein
MLIYVRLKEQPVRDPEMIRPTLPAGDVVEKLSIDKTSHAELVVTPEQKPEDVFHPYYVLDDGWGCKVRGRKGQGTGRMSHLKDVPRKARNGFRARNTYLSAADPKVALRKQGGGEKRKLVRNTVPRRRLK